MKSTQWTCGCTAPEVTITVSYLSWTPPIPPPCWLYAVHNRDDVIIYIGVADNPVRRIRQHAARLPWWAEVSYIEAYQHANRITALCEEAGNLMWFRPVYNTAYPSPKSPLLTLPGTRPDRIYTYSPSGELLDTWVPKTADQLRAMLGDPR